MGCVEPFASQQSAQLAVLRASLGLLQDPEFVAGGEASSLRLFHQLRIGKIPRPRPSGPALTITYGSLRSVAVGCAILHDHPSSTSLALFNSESFMITVSRDIGREGQPLRRNRQAD